MQRSERDFGRLVWAHAAVPLATVALVGGSSSGLLPTRSLFRLLSLRPRPVHLPALVSQRQQSPLFGDFFSPPQLPADVAQGPPHEPEHRLHHFAPVPMPLLVFRLVEPLP